VTTVRAVLLIALASLAAAAIVALVSRAPLELRRDRPPADATDPSLAATFTEGQIERHDAYRRASYAGFAAGLALEVGVLLLLARGPLRAVLERASGLPGGWFTAAVVAAISVALITWVAALPLSFVRGFAIQQAWGLSTQAAGGWFTDSLRSLLVAAVMAAVASVTFFGLVRWQPRAWWLWGWAGFTLLTALLFFLYPVLIAPLFNRFTPLTDQSLSRQIQTLAADAGIEVDEVLVADASRRSTVENAYVAGLGATKRVVVYDTLLSAGDEAETRFVVAHELGHQIENHILKNLALSSAGLLGGFALLAWLSNREAIWSWAGATGTRDPAAIPLLLVFATVVGILMLPLQNVISRHFETEADRHALELTEDPDTAIRVQRRLAFSNLADLDPPAPAVWLLYTHPPVRDRIAAAVAERRTAP
jgi:STE24 endopeptidase